MKSHALFVYFSFLICIIPIVGGAQNQISGYSINSSSAASTADTQYGKVAGYIENGIFIYKGIPYAEAERFMPPHAPKVWNDIRSSRSYGPTCPQEFRNTWLMDKVAFASRWDDGYPGEDCLRVNIWTPGINDNKKRPVMVWIHGGGFATGSGQEQPAYDGASLSKKGDVVIVSLNHRLNVLGFLNLSDFGDKYKYSANVGLLDIVEALKWVKNNIVNFGGDPDNVTIFGQSGGGRKVSTLLCMDKASGLFGKAIVQSGSGAKFMPNEYSHKIGLLTAKYLRLDASNIDNIQTVSYAQLLEAGTKACTDVKKEADADGISQKVSIWGWMPTKDGDLLLQNAFENGSEKISKDIPMMVGTCLNEFAGFAVLSTSNWFEQTDQQIRDLLYKTYGDRTDDYIRAFKSVYPNLKVTDMPLIDFKYRSQALAQVETKAKGEGAKVWNYLFVYQSPALDGVMTASHCMELPFVFNNVARCASETGATVEGIRLGDIMSSAWINFARTGNPNGANVPSWSDYTLKNKATMLFDTSKCEVKSDFDKQLLDVSLMIESK
ncbi:MAG: carboxylesterase [Bacteroidetes bacterium]|nr:carboxylesterase [Bacteroidota bacterium]